MGDETLYKILSAEDWAAARARGEVAPSADDRRDGFIHLSTGAQVLETARRHFAGIENLLALEIDRAVVAADLKYELAPKRGEHFPHLYGKLPASAVTRVLRVARRPDGSLALADGEGE